jgi:MFS transporter, DHA1 family, tetracycline resistance protein
MATEFTIDPVVQKRATRFVLMAVFISSAGFGIIMPALPQLIQQLEGVTLSEATKTGAWIGATYAIFQFLLGPTMGNFGDRFGRRPVFLIALSGFAIDFVLMGLAPSVVWLFIGRGIAGALGAIFGPANATMADISSAENRAASFGKVGAAFGLGFIFGPAVGGFLGDYSARLPFFVASAMAFSVFLYGYFTFPETMAPERRRPFEWRRANPLGALMSLSKQKTLLPIAAIYFLWVSAVNIYPAAWSYFAPAQFGWGTKMVGLSLTLVGISMVVFQALVLGKVVARFGERRTTQIAMVYGAFSFLLTALVTNGWVILAFTLTNGFQGMAMPAINAMMSRRLPPDQQGELQGFNGSLAALSILFAQIIYNNVLAYFTSETTPIHFPGAPFLIASAMALISLIALSLLPKAQSDDVKA